MRHRLVITDEVEAAIKAELEKIPHASLVARESKGAWSYATVWRVAVQIITRRRAIASSAEDAGHTDADYG
jgi:hypothetical protein